MAGQMIAFSIALAGRINVLKAEIVAKQLAHERLERDITEKKNIELEQKVKERTRDLEQSNEEIRTQASEIERQARLLDDQKNRQLMNKTLEILQKNEFLPEVGKFLEKLSPQLDDQLKRESKELQKKMTQNLHEDAHWENLKLHFEETHPNLFAVLHERCPKLSPNDLRHCAYQKMGLSKKEIASLLNLDPASVNKQQYRIKQKLQLDEDVSFADFIMSIH
jgi:DNA-binding NarL/FixJ family response regulator